MRNLKIEFFIGDLAEVYIIHGNGLTWVYHNHTCDTSAHYWTELYGKEYFRKNHPGLTMLEKAND